MEQGDAIIQPTDDKSLNEFVCGGGIKVFAQLSNLAQCKLLRGRCPVSHFLEDFRFFIKIYSSSTKNNTCCTGCQEYKYCTLKQTGLVVFEICVKI